MSVAAARQVVLPPPANGGVDVLVIAGEHSGDQHAARMVAEFKANIPGAKVCALGGEQLEKAGAQRLFDLPAHSVVGLVEVLKNYGFFKRLFQATLDWIASHRPKVVCLVDYPGFNLRLAKALNQKGLAAKAGGSITLAYYISPQIWAWKAHRRFRMAQMLDRMAVIFPFEVDCYADTDLPTQFVGHPFLEPDHELPVSYAPEGPILLLPGSRRQPVERIFPVMLESLRSLLRDLPNEHAVALYPDALIHETLQSILARYPEIQERITLQSVAGKADGKAVLTSSGTMSLACALAGLPGAICYRAHPFTYWVGRQVVKVPHLGIANLLLPDTPPYPEYIQSEANPDVLAAVLKNLIQNTGAREDAQSAAEQLRAQLSTPPEASAGRWLAEALGKA